MKIELTDDERDLVVAGLDSLMLECRQGAAMRGDNNMATSLRKMADDAHQLKDAIQQPSPKWNWLRRIFA